MSTNNKVLLIDAGNTAIKAALFQNNKLSMVERFQLDSFNELLKWSELHEIQTVCLCSVLSKQNTESLQQLFPNSHLINNKSTIPFDIKYDSRDSLGMDRLCNAAYAIQNKKTSYAVVIDIGTCVKFDLVGPNNDYLGGSISPGINLRYKSLNENTGNLPLLSNKTVAELVGNSTKSSIHSGVINGMTMEISGLMSQYSDQFDDLTFFVTGGDAPFFDLHSKNDIFADENLTLMGLFVMYQHNA